MLLFPTIILTFSSLACTKPLVPSPNDDEYLQNHLDAQNNPFTFSSQNALVVNTNPSNPTIDCISDTFMEDELDEDIQKRNVLANNNACKPSDSVDPNDAQGTKHPADSTQRERPPEEEGNRKSDENPCKDPYKLPLYCGGPWVIRNRGDSVMNCEHEFKAPIPARGMFRAASKIARFCCQIYNPGIFGRYLYEGVSCVAVSDQPEIEKWDEFFFNQWMKLKIKYSQPS